MYSASRSFTSHYFVRPDEASFLGLKGDLCQFDVSDVANILLALQSAGFSKEFLKKAMRSYLGQLIKCENDAPKKGNTAKKAAGGGAMGFLLFCAVPKPDPIPEELIAIPVVIIIGIVAGIGLALSVGRTLEEIQADIDFYEEKYDSILEDSRSRKGITYQLNKTMQKLKQLYDERGSAKE